LFNQERRVKLFVRVVKLGKWRPDVELMKITKVHATWLRYPIPEAKQHVSDFWADCKRSLD
jgi:hypothetical protein